MPTLTTSEDVPHPPDVLYALVADVEAYPAFLPWIAAVEVTDRGPDRLRCRVAARHKGFALDLDARIRFDPLRAVEIEAAGAWFRALRSRWELSALPDGGTRVMHALRYDLAVPGLSLMAGPLLARATPKVVARFRARADALA